MKLRHLLIGVFVVAVLLLGVMSVLAQDTIPTPSPVLPPNTESPESILRIVWASLLAGSATIGGSVLVTALVNLAKVIIPASVASGDTLKNVITVVVWIGYSLAIRFGIGEQFKGLADFLVPILVTATPLVGVLIGSAKLYLAARAHNTPIWGYQRT